ncbi:hypothetical protein F5146DRAFT_1006702 [Armillaria mellea]|nr:hypothetical protein F5146DRAFT_1006702 [Armillaria mellea]
MSLDQSIPEVGAYTMVLFKDGARNRKDLVIQVRERRVVMTGSSWSGGRLGDWGCEENKPYRSGGIVDQNNIFQSEIVRISEVKQDRGQHALNRTVYGAAQTIRLGCW